MADMGKEHKFGEQDRTSYEKEVITIHIGNTPIQLIAQEHTEFSGDLDPTIRSLIQSEETGIVVAEYFYDEVAQRLRNVPLAGAFLERRLENHVDGSRFSFSDALILEAFTAGKTVAVVDCANSAEYELHWALGPIPYMLTAAILQQERVPAALRAVSAALGTTSALQWSWNRVRELIHRKGMFDRRGVSVEERFLLDAEDARRIYIAEGLQKLAELQNGFPNLPKQIIVPYPRAHQQRIAHYLSATGADLAIRKAKKQVYDLLLPGIDRFPRLYQPDSTNGYISL